jgi:Zn-dependent alcohol dehydrogenase
MEVYNKSLCQPRELLVEIAQEYPEEVEHIFIPSCVVLTRCAGCCNDEMLECTPTSTHNMTMEVRDGAFYILTLTSPSHFFYNPTSSIYWLHHQGGEILTSDPLPLTFRLDTSPKWHL